MRFLKVRLEAVTLALVLCVAGRADAQPRASGGLNASERSQRLDVQHALAMREAIKISVQRAGWYRVTQAQLLAAGLPANTNPHNLRLFADGVEQPLRIVGRAQGRLEPHGAIEFYGTGVDTPFTDTRVYWLVSDTPGLRVSVADGRTTSAATARSFPFTVERRDRTIYFAALKNNGGNKYFGDVVGSWGATETTLTLGDLDASSPSNGSLEVSLQGVTNDPNVALDHRVGVLINGVEVGEVSFDGQGVGAGRFDVPHNRLVNGANAVSFVARGGDFDFSLVDRVGLTYWRYYRAEGDTLRFTALAHEPVTIHGFSRSDIRLVDVTDAEAPYELVGTTRTDESGGFQITAVPQGGGTRTLMAFSNAAIDAPAAVTLNRTSNWSAAGTSADYVIVTHGDFIEAVRPLETLRQRQGHRTALVDVEDLYDEFSFGEKTPQAIKDFMSRAHAGWRTPPRFLLLVGNATTDPRNFQGMGEVDYVPVQLVATAALEVPSDDWFADADGDGRNELAAVGRLPARDAAQAHAMVAKIQAYEAAGGGGWTKNVLLVADENDADTDFEDASHGLAALVPYGYQTQTVFRGRLGTDAARGELLGGINQGQLIVNYIGHGSVDVWHDNLLTGESAAALTNEGRLPLVVAMTCLNGFFHGLFPEESLAESLMRAPNGGAIAVWASSAPTAPAGQLALDRELFRLLFTGAYPTLGEAVAAAKRATGDSDVRRSWILFGDPATRLKGLPQPQ